MFSALSFLTVILLHRIKHKGTTKDAATFPSASDKPVPEIPAHIHDLLNLRYDRLDSKMSEFHKVFQDVGAYQCWHKHSTFGEHLLGVWRVFQCWRQSEDMCRMALFHSTYSNSWVALTLFRPGADRHRLEALIGKPAEELVHLMCSVPRLELTFREIMGKGVSQDGIPVVDIRTKQVEQLSRRKVAIYLIFHIADWLDQNFSWQDDLFNNQDAKLGQPFVDILDKTFRENPGPLWPGAAKPGLYLAHLSHLATILKSCEQKDLIPPIFNNCETMLDYKNEVDARDAYWDVVINWGDVKHAAQAQEGLERAIRLNPFIAEPHVVLAHIFIRRQQWKEAEAECLVALKLFIDFGTCWDKRLKWEAWIGWVRTMLLGIRAQSWPTTSMGMIGLGLTWQTE